jgi:hypothetical protein
MIAEDASKLEDEKRVSIDDYEDESLKLDKHLVDQSIDQMFRISDFLR